MTQTELLAKHFRDLYYAGNWTAPSLKDQLEGVTWQQATIQVHGLNTIAKLVFHINYYVAGLRQVLEGGPLDIRDKYSYDMPPINSQEDWEKLLAKTWADGKAFADLVEQMPEERLKENMLDGKYGNYLQNILGIIQHCFYHLGQVALIKKIVQQGENN